MVSLTLSVSQEMKRKMNQFPEINWSEVARSAINRRLSMLAKFKEFIRDSDFTEEDALELGRKVTKAAFRRHKERWT